MKNYQAPRLVAIGSVVERTEGAFIGQADPSGNQQVLPTGSIGFNL